MKEKKNTNNEEYPLILVPGIPFENYCSVKNIIKMTLKPSLPEWQKMGDNFLKIFGAI